MMRMIMIVSLLLCTWQAAAQNNSDINQKDLQGKAHGQWLLRQPARMGEPATTEWGSYDHGIRTGVWYRFDGEGEVAAIERYRLGMLDGEAKYFENGRLTTVGHYRGLNPGYAYDTIYVIDPVTDAEQRRIISTERGTVKNGIWQFYDERGRLTREIDYVIDEPVARQEFSIASTDSAWYRKREAAKATYPKHYYRPPAEKRVRYTNFK